MQTQTPCELQKIRNYCHLYFYFNTVFQRQISYTEMTNLLQLTINVPKSHEQHAIFPHEPQSALSLTVTVRQYPPMTKLPTNKNRHSQKYWGQFNKPRHNIRCVSDAVPWVPKLSLTGCPGECRHVMQ